MTLFQSYEASPGTEANVVDIKCYLGYALVLSEDREKGLELLESEAAYFESTHGSDHYNF